MGSRWVSTGWRSRCPRSHPAAGARRARRRRSPIRRSAATSRTISTDPDLLRSPRLPRSPRGAAMRSCTLSRTSSRGRIWFGHHHRFRQVRDHLRHPGDRADRDLAGGLVARHGPTTDVVSARRELTGSTGSPIRTRPARTTSAYIPNGSPPRPPMRGRCRAIMFKVLKSFSPVSGARVVTMHRGILSSDADRGFADADELTVPRVFLVRHGAFDLEVDAEASRIEVRPVPTAPEVTDALGRHDREGMDVLAVPVLAHPCEPKGPAGEGGQRRREACPRGDPPRPSVRRSRS